MAVCCTKAWGSQISSSSWWVYAWQAQMSDRCVTDASEELHERSYGQDDNILPLVNPIAKTKELMEEHEYPDIRLDVPMVRLQYESDYTEDYSVIDFATKFRPKKQKVPTKEQETKEYLEKKAEEERKGSAGSNERSESPKLGKEEDLLNSNQEAGTSPGTEAKAIEERTSNAVDERLGKDVKCQQGSLNEEVAWSEEMEKQPPNFENVPITEPVPPECDLNISSESNAGIYRKDLPEELKPANGSHTYNSYNFPSGKDFNRQTVQRAVENDDDDREAKITSTDEGTEGLMSELLSNPEPDDVLLYAVPMVGPYQVFQNFKFKVKLTPGSSKKGKAGKMAVDLFLRMKDIGQCERELIRALAVEDKSWTNIPTGCRVSAPQLHAKK
ncbi:hypothetical protein ANCDUO_18926 [Ancylostoma duodenale]|uniref:NFACT protein C-terminal domain-containing protein n=1 Tax=Ancylostoma duodenale TaxID=51022 RepID=A0A0C2G1R6_9BILA|nr:hypothetical protein ANCDUO_18926 [Ancylostoma duodenale]